MKKSASINGNMTDAKYAVGTKVVVHCGFPDGRHRHYSGKVKDVRRMDDTWESLVHLSGLPNTFNEWICENDMRIMPRTNEAAAIVEPVKRPDGVKEQTGRMPKHPYARQMKAAKVEH